MTINHNQYFQASLLWLICSWMENFTPWELRQYIMPWVIVKIGLTLSPLFSVSVDGRKVPAAAGEGRIGAAEGAVWLRPAPGEVRARPERHEKGKCECASASPLISGFTKSGYACIASLQSWKPRPFDTVNEHLPTSVPFGAFMV